MTRNRRERKARIRHMKAMAEAARIARHFKRFSPEHRSALREAALMRRSRKIEWRSPRMGTRAAINKTINRPNRKRRAGFLKEEAVALAAQSVYRPVQ